MRPFSRILTAWRKTEPAGDPLPDKPIDILVRMPNWLGDCVMAMPALRYLVETLPEAKLHLAARQAFRNLLAAQPGVSGFVEAPESGLGKLIKGMCVAKEALQGAGLTNGADIGVLFTNSLSTAAWMWRTGAAVRVGYHLDARSLFLSHPVSCGERERSWHFTRYYLRLAQAAAELQLLVEAQLLRVVVLLAAVLRALREAALLPELLPQAEVPERLAQAELQPQAEAQLQRVVLQDVFQELSVLFVWAGKRETTVSLCFHYT